MADRSVRVILQAVVAPYQAAMAQATASTKALGAQVATASGGLKGMSKAGAGLQSALANPMAAIASPAGLTAVALVGSAKAAIDFESAWAGVTKTVEGTPEQLNAVRAGIRDLAKEIPASTGEIAAVAEAAGQLGIETDSILDFSRVMIDLGNTTNLSANEAATALARFAAVTQMSHEEFDRLGSVVVDLGNNFETTEAEIVEFAQRIAGAGEIAGLNEAEIVGIGTALSSVGVGAEAGGTAVQKVLLSITEEVQKGGDKLEQFAETAGMSAQQFAKDWREDPAKAFTAFVEGLGESGKGAIGILKELGLTDQRLIRSFLSLAGAGDNLNEAITTGNRAWEENEALTEEAEKRYETTAAQLEILWNNVNDLAISVGENLLPAINSVLGPLSDLVGVAGDVAGKLELVNQIPGIGTVKQLGSTWSWVKSIFTDEVSPALIEAAGAEDDLRYSAYLATDATEDQVDATEDLGGEAEETTDALKDLNAEMDRLFGVHVDAERASLDFADALVDMREKIDGAGGSLNRHTEEGREARRSILDAAKAAEDHAVAVAKESGSVDKGVVALKRHIDNLKEDAEAAGISEEAMSDYIRELGYTPKNIRTLIELNGIEKAQAQLQGLMGSLGAIDGWAAAATVTVTKLPKFHSGGIVGSAGSLRSDEVPAILQRGEMVLSKAEVQSGRSASGVDGQKVLGELKRIADRLQNGVADFSTTLDHERVAKKVTTTTARNKILLGVDS